jgi:hypothetical protein
VLLVLLGVSPCFVIHCDTPLMSLDRLSIYVVSSTIYRQRSERKARSSRSFTERGGPAWSPATSRPSLDPNQRIRTACPPRTGPGRPQRRRGDRINGTSIRLGPARWNIDPVETTPGTGHLGRMRSTGPVIPVCGPDAGRQMALAGRKDTWLSLWVQATEGKLAPWPRRRGALKACRFLLLSILAGRGVGPGGVGA